MNFLSIQNATFKLNLIVFVLFIQITAFLLGLLTLRGFVISIRCQNLVLRDVALIWAAGASLLLILKKRFFLFFLKSISLIGLSSSIIKKSLILLDSTGINSIIDELLSVNRSNIARSIDLSDNICGVLFHIVAFWGQYIIIGVTQNLVDFAHVLLLHLGIQLATTHSTEDRLILIDDL